MSPRTPKYVVNIDGASRGNPGHAAFGLVVQQGDDILLEKADYLGITTNNVAEYSAFVAALTEIIRLGLSDVLILSDSELVVKQMRGEYKVKSEHLLPLYLNARRLFSDIEGARIAHVPREKNRHADKLANKVLDDVRKSAR